jgi:NADPH:quinone reductase-like Zn-dependent oxidoreductase
MKAWIVPKGCQKLEALRLEERPTPTPGPTQILARMRAASLNYRDQLVVSGRYFGGAVQRDTVPLSDGAGEVVAAGSQVTRFKAGDRIVSTFFQNWVDGPPTPEPRPAIGSPMDGVLAEYVLFDQRDAVALPANLSFEEGATLSCAGVTAWHALMIHCAVKPGDSVLVLGTGGVSIFALQLAHLAGAHVYMTSSSDVKLERGRALGATGLINYKSTPEWDKEVLRLTEGRGVNYVVEVGGPGTLARSMQSVGYAGKIALIGFLAGMQGDTNPQPLMRKGASLHGIFVGNRAMLERLCAAIEVNRMQPIVDKIFPLDQALDAYRYQQSGAHFGKIVIRI